MKIYDMTIDPLTSPKGLDIHILNEFYGFMMQLKRKDIMFFENILDYVEENDDLEEKDVERYTLYQKTISFLKVYMKILMICIKSMI